MLDSHTAKHHKLEQFNLCEFRREWRGAVNFFPVFSVRKEGSFAQLFFSHWKCLSSGVPPGFMGLKADPLHPEKISEPLYKSTGNTPFIMHQPCISNNAELLHECNAKSRINYNIYNTTSSWIKTYFKTLFCSPRKKARFLRTSC